MTELRQRRDPIRSKAIRRAAAGQRCTLNLPNICNYDADTVVLAHITDESFGRGQKADDTSGMFCCAACHSAYDLRRTGLAPADLLSLVLRAYQRTIRRLVLMGVIQIPEDKPKPFAARPTKPRAPKAERKPVAPRENAWPPKGSRKLPTRKTLEARQ
jgi:hypothetical protein